jgi:signal transduction histidine kinase
VEPHVHVAITDVSKMKQAQRVIEEVNREQETFNYSISHDLRAPLVTINNYAGIIMSDFGSGLDPQAKGMVERIRIAAQRMEDTLKRLQEYSTLAREEVVIQPVNVDSVLTDLLIEHRALIEQKNADILVDRPLPTVRGARVLLGHILSNLLTNAIKYTQPGEAPQVRIFAEVTETHAEVRVVDQGIGIDPQYHQRIFKVFERLHGYSRYPGSGVGLAIARRAVERMNGRIWCESEPGKGSCFIVELPKA